MFKNISIIGQGYVGLPLGIILAKLGHKVLGVDTSKQKVELLNSGVSGVEDVSNLEISEVIDTGLYEATTEFSRVGESDVVIICVPTPLDKNHNPDLSYLESALADISAHIKKGTLIILESTVAPGTTRGIVVESIEKNTNLPISDFSLVFSPERIDPRNLQWNIKNTPKLVAGLTNECLDIGFQFYSSFIDNVIKCDSLEVAETAKLLENSFRLVNISFINELSLFCEKIGIDINAVVKAAATKPYGYMPFYPSIGVGGHCIPVDPVYLATTAKAMEVQTKFLDLAIQVNSEMPNHYVNKVKNKLGSLKNKKIIVVGVAYKPNISDVRETPVASLMDGLRDAGAEVYWHDSLVKEWKGQTSVDLSSDYDLAIIATRHDNVDLKLLNGVPLITVGGKNK